VDFSTLRAQLLEGRTGRHRARPARVGAIGFVVLVVMVVAGSYASVTGYLPFVPRGGNLVSAEFDTAFNLNTSTPVRVKGINVGEVDRIESRDGGRSARVVMRIDDRGRELLRADARAAVWSRLVLGGPAYIELTPGRSEQPLGEESIPLNRTSTQVGIDEVLGALTPNARNGLKKTLAGVRTTFSDPTTAGAAIDKLAPDLKPLAPAVQGLRGTKDGDLGDVVRGFDEIVTALGREESQLAGLIDGAGTTLAVTAARRADLASLLEVAPSALRRTRVELAGLDRTLQVLQPLARELRPGVRRAAPALTELRPALTRTRTLLRYVRPLVGALDPAVSALRTTASRGTALMNDIQPTITRSKDSLLPFLHSEDPSTKTKKYQLPGPTVAAVDALSAQFDTAGNVAHFNPTFGARAFHDYLPCEVYATDSDPKRRVVCEDLTDFVLSLFGRPPPAKSAQARLAKAIGGKKR